MKFCGRQRRRLKGSLFGAPQGDCRGNPAEQSGRHSYATGITHQGHMRHSGSILISNETR